MFVVLRCVCLSDCEIYYNWISFADQVCYVIVVRRLLRIFRFSFAQLLEYIYSSCGNLSLASITSDILNLFTNKLWIWFVKKANQFCAQCEFRDYFTIICVGLNYYEFAKRCWYDESNVTASSSRSIAASIFSTRRIWTISTHTKVCTLSKPRSRKFRI